MGTRQPRGGGVGTATRDMSPEELLGEVARRLEGAGIPYMITGSFASSMLGLPRSTRDLDVRGVPVMFLRAEDSILSKLEWIRQGGSSRQMEDAGNVVDMQGAALDWAYMERWAKEIGVSDLLEQLRQKSSQTD